MRNASTGLARLSALLSLEFSDPAGERVPLACTRTSCTPLSVGELAMTYALPFTARATAALGLASVVKPPSSFLAWPAGERVPLACTRTSCRLSSSGRVTAAYVRPPRENASTCVESASGA